MIGVFFTRLKILEDTRTQDQMAFYEREAGKGQFGYREEQRKQRTVEILTTRKGEKNE